MALMPVDVFYCLGIEELFIVVFTVWACLYLPLLGRLSRYSKEIGYYKLNF